MYTDIRSRRITGHGRIRRLTLAAAAAGLALAALPVSVAAAVPLSRVGYQGHSFGSYVSAAGAVRSGPSAVSALGCGPPAGFKTSNSAATTAVPGSMSVANVVTTGSTAASPDRSATTARAAAVDVLGGRVTANLVKAVSITTHDSAGYHTDATETTFSNLMVLGVPVVGTPAPNTTVLLPGVGHVVLNEQHSSVTATSGSLTVLAVHAYVTESSPSGPVVGTNIIVAGALSAITAPTGGFLTGTAYGSSGQVGSTLRSGPSFPETIPCAGTTNHVVTNVGAGVTVPGYLTTGATTDTARGVLSATTATGQTTATVADANLVNGLIKATEIRASAHVARWNGSTSLSDADSGFGSLTVNGKAVSTSVAPNTVMQFAGIGTLYLHRKIVTGNSVEVRMIEFVVTHTNPFHLPVGTDLRVAVASAGVH